MFERRHPQQQPSTPKRLNDHANSLPAESFVHVPGSRQPRPPLPRLAVCVLLLVLLAFFLVGCDRAQAEPGSQHSTLPGDGDLPSDPATLSGSPPEGPANGQVVSLPLFLPQSLPSAAILRRPELHTEFPTRPRIEVLKYTVTEGDSLFRIAERFNLTPETILWGNYDLLYDNPNSLRPGLEINILPLDGAFYRWHAGDGLNGVAAYFNVKPLDIVEWPGNEFPLDLDFANPEIAPGTMVFVPGGVRPFVGWQAPVVGRTGSSGTSTSRPARRGQCATSPGAPIGEGYFIWPTSATHISGYSYASYHPGVDIGGRTGNAIFAAASGAVVYAGWNDTGYGYMVVIDHGDGWQTLYAHLSAVNVTCGQAVYQGNVIGGLGSTGNSSGPHLHFEMSHPAYGRVNPLGYVSP